MTGILIIYLNYNFNYNLKYNFRNYIQDQTQAFIL